MAVSFSLLTPKATSTLCFQREDAGFGVGDGFFDVRDGDGFEATLFPLQEDPNEGDKNEVAKNGA